VLGTDRVVCHLPAGAPDLNHGSRPRPAVRRHFFRRPRPAFLPGPEKMFFVLIEDDQRPTDGLEHIFQKSESAQRPTAATVVRRGRFSRRRPRHRGKWHARKRRPTRCARGWDASGGPSVRLTAGPILDGLQFLEYEWKPVLHTAEKDRHPW